MVKNAKRLLAILFVFILISTAGILAGRTQADIEGTPKRGPSAVDLAEKGGQSNLFMISADGRYVAFQSYATNLVRGDWNHFCESENGNQNVNCPDVFVADRETGAISRVSVSSDGTQGDNGSAHEGSISADGRYVAFSSAASNLVGGDTNGTADVFVRDRQTGQTSRVSLANGGTQGNRYSYWPSISADGRFVAFGSLASNLVPGDTNEVEDIFLHDRLTGETSRVSVAGDGTQGESHSYQPSISADGRFVAFYSESRRLVIDDSNGVDDVFVHDRLSGGLTRISVASDGTQANGHSYQPSISADGRYLAFSSDASNLVGDDTNGTYDIFLHDRQTQQTTRVSLASDGTQADSGNFGSHYPYLTADGRYLTFGSFASNLVEGDTNEVIDVFVRDLVSGETSRVSVASDGTQGNADSYSPSSISANGRYVVFYSDANNLDPNDTNAFRDIFLHDRVTGRTECISLGIDKSFQVSLLH
jgi:Tol biopolymer transport system component